MRILGAFLTDFHKELGLRLVVSDPVETPLTVQLFPLYAGLIQPREQLCNRTLAMEYLDEYYLVACPQISKSNAYNRAIFIYTASILVAKEDFLQPKQRALYKEAVLTLARFFRVIEEMHRVIYEDRHPEYLRAILAHFRAQINNHGHCHLTHLGSHYAFINSSTPPHTQDAPLLTPATVPVTLLTQQEIDRVESQFGRQLLQYALEGTYTLRKICRLHRDRDRKDPEVREFYLRACEKGVVFLLDLLSLNNCYALTAKIKDYLPEQPRHSQLAEIARAVAVGEPVDSQELLCLYLQFNRVTVLHKVVELNRKLLTRIDVQKLVRLGQIFGFLKRIHEKIMYMEFPQPLIVHEVLKRLQQERGAETSERALREESEKLAETVKNNVMAGLTVDEMMVNLDVDYDRLLRLLSAQNRFVLKVSSPQ